MELTLFPRYMGIDVKGLILILMYNKQGILRIDVMTVNITHFVQCFHERLLLRNEQSWKIFIH